MKSLNENKNYNVSRIIKSWYILSGLFLIVSSLFYIDFLKLLGVHEDFIDTAFYAPLLCIRNYIVGSFFFHSSFLIYKEVTHINSVFTLISLSTTISIFYKFYNLGIIALIYSQAAGAVVGVGFIFIYCRKLGFSDFSSILGTIILSISLLIHYLSFNLNFSTLDKLVIFIFFSGFFYMIDKVYNNQFISENINLIFRGLYDGKAQR